MRSLDQCLDTVESAIEEGNTQVSVAMAAQLSAHVRGIRPGMPLSAALEAVFGVQQIVLASGDEGLLGDRSHRAHTLGRAWSKDKAVVVPPESRPTMSEAEARDVTARIKSNFDDLCMLLLEAHERRAWEALGYDSWGQYVRQELALSRSRSYELLDQATVRRTLQAATESPDVPQVSSRLAATVKPMLERISSTIRARLAEERGRPGATAASERAIVREVLAEVRREARGDLVGDVRGEPAQQPVGATTVDAATLIRAIEYIASIPPYDALDDMLAAALTERLSEMTTASRRLVELSEHARRRQA